MGEAGEAQDAEAPDLADMPPALAAGAMPLPIPPPPPVPAMTGLPPSVRAFQAGTAAAAGAGRPVLATATGTTPEAPPTALPDGNQPDQPAMAEPFGGGMPAATWPEAGAPPRPAPRAGPAPSPASDPWAAAVQQAAAPPAAGAAQANAAPQEPTSASPDPVPATPPPIPRPRQAAPEDPAKPSPSRDRPMALAAAIGQATAQEQMLAPSDQPAPLPERIGPEPAALLPVPHWPAESAKAQPAPPDPLQAMPQGLSPLSTAPASTDGIAPAAPAGTVPVAPPPPPARQVAQVTIALALGQGRAPRLTVALEPESLGRVEIRIERGADGDAASVRVLAERPETLALLQRDARELDRTLAQAGVVVASGGMQFGLSGGQGGATQDQRPQQQGGGQGRDQGGGQAPLALAGPVQTTLNALSILDIAV
ncbi:flagellar hook-length control protein FliK [Belnapia sp. F-4-1]|uniref:flagellar hook-length control protein FliK n=1 Tax=Belnapia sp. F-4-1 TaxID=1545443 RepID=UPI0005BC17F4|nr:flagellar hook-length control protein FliK [Belnapia sp. F-4-1]